MLWGGGDTESDFSVHEDAMIVMGEGGGKQVDRLSKFRWTWGDGVGGTL